MALIEITDNIKCLLHERNYVFGTFIDFKNAFDTVDHEIMLKKIGGMQICFSDHI